MNIETVNNQFKTQEVLAKHKKAVSLSWISELLEHEIDARREKSLMARIKKANFPEITTLETFDWSFNPKINKQQIHELATLNFIGNHSGTSHRNTCSKQRLSCLL
jgi:DNA replication protein DnaC